MPIRIKKKSINNTLNSASRYNKLKYDIDHEEWNSNWIEIEVDSSRPWGEGLNFIDLFSGAGGISCGFVSAGFSKIFSVEIDKDASSTIRHNFPNSTHFELPIEHLTDTVIMDEIAGMQVDVICGGPPCQGFSVAGLRNPHDPRNMLFAEYLRVVKIVMPKFIMIENVPGILTMGNGAVCHEILRQLNNIGYEFTSVRILEAAEYGVPQLRTRAIFIGNRLNMKNPYPKPKFTKENYRTIESAIDDLKNLPFDPKINHHGTTHRPPMIEQIRKVSPGGSLYDTFRDAWKRQYKGVPCMTIKENHGGVHIHYELDRVLTAREMARLQTFPDEFIFSGTFKRAYWQIGNAVPCLLANEIAQALGYALKNTDKMKRTPMPIVRQLSLLEDLS